MQDSIWTESLATFRDQVGGAEPVPAGVSISAVTASLALALLAKVLDINGKRKDFSGDREKLEALIDAARSESTRLTELADDDVAAFNQYLECVRKDDAEGKAAAMRDAIAVPMDGARAAVRGLDLCADGVILVRGLTMADLTIAAALLSGAVRAMLVSVDFNILSLKRGPTNVDEQFLDGVSAERRALEIKALHRDEAITSAVSSTLE